MSRAGCHQCSPPPSLFVNAPNVPSSPGHSGIPKPVGRGSCLNSPYPSDGTQLSRGGEGMLDKTVKQRPGFVYLICLTQFPGPTGMGSELGDGVRKRAWFPSFFQRLSWSFRTLGHLTGITHPRALLLRPVDLNLNVDDASM